MFRQGNARLKIGTAYISICYGYLNKKKILVAEGDAVEAGQALAELG